MNLLVSKLLPWALAGVLAGGLVFGFAKYERAIGAAKAHRQVAERLTEDFKRDSTALVKLQAERQQEKQESAKRLAVATVRQRVAARRADSLAAELSAELPDSSKPKLAALEREHANERAQFAAKEAEYKLRIQLLVADSTDAQRQIAALRQINSSLRAATEAVRPSFVQKVSPYVLGAAALAGGIAVAANSL